jgi:hypothetical protein
VETFNAAKWISEKIKVRPYDENKKEDGIYNFLHRVDALTLSHIIKNKFKADITALETALKAAEEKAKDAEERMAQSVDWICLRIFCDHSQNVHCDKHLTEFCTETACPLIPKEV